MESKLIYRRQFLLSSKAIRLFRGWNSTVVGGFYLYTHPDLEISHLQKEGFCANLSLVGYAIDPYEPDLSNLGILKRIISDCESFDCIVEYLHGLGGRFVLIVNTRKGVWIFHDPCGLRMVYYCRDRDGVYVGSDPNIIKEIVPLKEDDRIKKYYNSLYYKKDVEHWIPAGCSLYENLKHLIPNHALDLSSLRQIRYWPKNKIKYKPIDVVAKQVSGLLKGLMVSAGKRFKLALPMTAGWDSRLLLSAVRENSDQIFYYTLKYRDLRAASADIKVPKKLLGLLGLNYSIIECNGGISQGFAEVYRKNSYLAHINDWGQIAYGMMGVYPEERVCVKGNCAEIGRCFYYKSGYHDKIVTSAQIVALVPGWKELDFVCDCISDWFDDANQASVLTNVDILDLFYWEHRLGSWQAQSQLEWDIVQEVFTPFNNRLLLEMMLSVPKKYRADPSYLYVKVMKMLWPEVLMVGVNPFILMTFVRSKFKRLLVKLCGRAG